MARGIRIASPNDESAILEFFTAMVAHRADDEGRHSVRMLHDLMETLFARDAERLTVFAYEGADGAIQGIAAVREPDEAGAAELITVQVFNTVQGKGIGQTLLRRAIDHVRQAGATLLHTVVESEDVRSRGFLRREGFVAELAENERSDMAGGVVRYIIVWPPNPV